MPPKKGSKAAGSMGDPSLCRHGGPRATSHILECLNMMINHNKFGVSEEDFALCADDEEKVRAVLLKKMKTFMISHPEAASDDSIKTLVAMAVDELLLNGDLENARLFYQPVPFLRFFKKYGVKGLEERQTALSKAADTVNGVAEVKGMLDTLKVDVGNSCKCLSLFTPGAPLKPQAKEPAGATYEQCLTLPFLKIPVKRLNAMGQDSRLHVEIRRLCAPNDHPPYLCIIIAPASRYIFHSFPIDETDAEKAFMHVLEAIVMAVVSEGMGMIDEAVRIRPAQLTVTDPLLAKYLSPLLEGTRVSVAASSDKVINADSDAKTKETPLIAIMDGVYADFNVDLLKARTTHKLPIGDTMAEEAKFKVKSRTASGKEKYVADPAAEERDIPVRMMACKGCKLLMTRKVVKQCSLCSEVWYCGSDCQSSDWSAGHKTECNRKNEGKKTNKGAGHVSEDSGDDLRDHARNEALDSFAIDLVKAVPAGGAKKKGGGKKGKGKGKKK